MIERPYFVYDAVDAQDMTGHRRVIEVTHYPLLDLRVLSALGYSHLSVIAGPMPLARAAHKADILKRRLHPHVPGQSLFTRFLGSFFQALSRKRGARRFDIATIHDCRNVILPADEDLNTLAETLRGRILFQHEVRKALSERGHHMTGNLQDMLQTLILKGVIGRVPSVAVGRFGIPSCRRCGNPNVVQASCASCSSDKCFYCPECASMGQARACRPLYYSPGERGCIPNEALTQSAAGFSDDFSHPDKPGFPNEFHNQGAPGSSNASDAYTGVSPGTSLDETSGNPAMGQNTLPGIKPGDRRNFAVSLPFELTPAQKHASQLVTDFLHDPGYNECLVFAVCGAGKTEVVFEAIANVLRSGGKALFAIPRSDVVAEVVPRIGSAIPDAGILELRSSAKSRYRDADIVIATTHQALRFFRAFDLVILDEVDAFPYRGSAILHYAVRRATAQHGKTVFMTATPDRELLRKADQDKIALVRISARHHGRPLPEPEIIHARLPLPEARMSLPHETGARNAPRGALDRLASGHASGHLSGYPSGHASEHALVGGVPQGLNKGRWDHGKTAQGNGETKRGYGDTRRDATRHGYDETKRSCGDTRRGYGETRHGHDETKRGYGATHKIAGNGLHLPDKVLAIIERSLRAGRKMFVFVPTVALSDLVCKGIANSLRVSGQPGQSPGNWNTTLPDSLPQFVGSLSPVTSSSQPKAPRIASIHAAHPNRDLHREAFRTGAIDIIVSTTVLERGITVPNADVLVLYADYERIFDTATLTQMAGRAGRAKDDTQAEVYFVARHVTASMHTAVRLIQDMNRHAARSGYLEPLDT
ncbi:MAG: DEAD/DEAH box helicase family protein [Firmicutes bacterium]|nr:DEAD/DEAH box helicase family protein [Bacillota bacterium]